MNSESKAMETRQTISVSTFLPAAFILAIVGWGGLAFLVIFTLPTVGPRWLFFFTSVLAISGSILPLIAFLHIRFPSKPPVTPTVVIRQAILAGIYFPTLAWLQIGRVLTSGLATILAAGLVILELLLRLRERSQWKP
jgi:heme/copper-type cytochrome/quinol oxidase subunit 4